MEAAGRGKSDVVAELLGAGAQVDQKNKRGESALMRAASQGQTEAVRALIMCRVKLKLGADPNVQDQDGQTALMEAAGRGKSDVVAELLGAGAQVDQKNKRGESALMRAASQGQTEAKGNLH
jgi:ankyrin repeat protein